MVCPLRFVLVFVSALIAAITVWKMNQEDEEAKPDSEKTHDDQSKQVTLSPD